MTATQAKWVERIIIGLCVLSILFIFQPFSILVSNSRLGGMPNCWRRSAISGVNQNSCKNNSPSTHVHTGLSGWIKFA